MYPYTPSQCTYVVHCTAYTLWLGMLRHTTGDISRHVDVYLCIFMLNVVYRSLSLENRARHPLLSLMHTRTHTFFFFVYFDKQHYNPRPIGHLRLT